MDPGEYFISVCVYGVLKVGIHLCILFPSGFLIRDLGGLYTGRLAQLGGATTSELDTHVKAQNSVEVPNPVFGPRTVMSSLLKGNSSEPQMPP
jgi:hypothetical protein